MSTNSEHEIVQGPSTTHRCECSWAPKTGAQLRDNPEEREKMLKKRPKPVIAAITHCIKSSTTLCCTTGLSTDSGDELNLKHCHYSTVAA